MVEKKDEVIKKINKFIKKVRGIINVERVILFGSRARGDYGKNSDIDLIIISKDFEGVKFFRRSPELYLLWDAPYNIDIICLTPKEFANKIKEIGILREATIEGIEL